MIDKDRIARAAREADREVEIHGLPDWAEKHGVDLSGLTYVAEQRALRGAMILDGLDATKRTWREVPLSAATRKVFPTLAATWIDGFACGFTAKLEVLSHP